MRFSLQAQARLLLSSVPDDFGYAKGVDEDTGEIVVGSHKITFDEARGNWLSSATAALGEQPPTTEKKARAAWMRSAVKLLGKAPSRPVARGTCSCLRKRVSNDQNILVLHAPGSQSAHYGNLQVCGNVWLCPVCAGKISERRREEMTTALESSGLFKALGTYTVRHQLGDSCADLTLALVDARARLKAHRRWKQLVTRYAIAGHIYNFEPLHNEVNGWHLHFHEILLFERELTSDELADLESAIKKLWGWALEQNSRDASWEHGFDLRAGDKYVQDYLAKYGRLPQQTGWTIEHELAKSVSKRSSKHGRTPIELLMLYGAGDKQAGALWLEFARAFKGAHQLQWSRGLKKRLGIVEKTDEEIALEEREPADILAELTIDQWRAVLAADARAELLNVAAGGDADKLQVWLTQLMNPPADSRSKAAPIEARDYTPWFITRALEADDLEAPDYTHPGADREILYSIYDAWKLGKQPAVRRSLETLQRLRPELEMSLAHFRPPE